jgi:hypothetical protein
MVILFPAFRRPARHVTSLTAPATILAMDACSVLHQAARRR